MSALTPTQRGIKLRLAASRERSAGHDDTADMIDDLADQIDPRPEWPDGLYCWRYDDGMTTYVRYVRRYDGEWIDGYGQPDACIAPPAICTRVRVLGEDEIALPRSTFTGYTWEDASKVAGRVGRYATSAIWRHIADALRAETTNQQVVGCPRCCEGADDPDMAGAGLCGECRADDALNREPR